MPGMTATDASESRSTSATLSMTSVMRSAAPEVLPYGMKLSPSYPALEYASFTATAESAVFFEGSSRSTAKSSPARATSSAFVPGGCAFCLGAALDLRAAFFDARVIVDVRAYP